MKIDSQQQMSDTLMKSYMPSVQNTSDKKDFNRILEGEVKKKDKEKLYKSCQDLESVFLNKVFDSMRATVPDSGFIEKSFATDTFESMLYEEYSKQISKTGSLGIADMIYKQLSQQL